MGGYQFRSTDAFVNYNKIDSPYVHGVLIPSGNNPRKHLWTYAAGTFENKSVSYNCPCNTGYSFDYYPPSFVGNHYYCESGNNQSYYEEKLYADDFLWDGENVIFLIFQVIFIAIYFFRMCCLVAIPNYKVYSKT